MNKEPEIITGYLDMGLGLIKKAQEEEGPEIIEVTDLYRQKMEDERNRLEEIKRNQIGQAEDLFKQVVNFANEMGPDGKNHLMKNLYALSKSYFKTMGRDEPDW